MKTSKFMIQSGYVYTLLIAFVTISFFTSCKEEIDDSNFAIKTEKTMSDYLAEDANLSAIKAIFDRVRLGNKPEASSITAALSARGNYTVFAPTNDAVYRYVQHLIGTTDINALSYEQAMIMAYNCVIDNGSDGAYETPDFPTKGTFGISNLNDRMLSCVQEEGTSDFIINGTSKVVTENIQVSNGMLHVVNEVISMSLDKVPELIAAAGNMRIMARLLQETGWAGKLVAEKDMDYEMEEHPDTKYFTSVSYTTFPIPQKRYLGFTGFVETDDVYASEWGITANIVDGVIQNWSDVLAIIKQRAEAAYGTEDSGDLTSPKNAVNRFVAYHFLEGRIPYDRFVKHFNEYGYKYGADPHNPQTIEYTVDVWDYYRTVGEMPDLLKVTQVCDGEHEIYINRVCKYDNGFDGKYQMVGSPESGEGLNILISDTNGEYENSAVNGYYFPINKILIKNSQVANALGGERIRFDLMTITPELISNNCRGNGYKYFPNGYFDGIKTRTSGTEIYYLHSQWNGGGAWQDYQGDEWIFSGLFDFVLRLPPVPRDGTYEFRAGIAQNTLRGMAQPYVGEDPNDLAPTGLPLDLRQSVDRSVNAALNWQEDVDDAEINFENDKNLRNQGYMKAPLYFMLSDGNASTTARALPFGTGTPVVRRIIIQQYMKANTNYYIRFKSALKKTDAQFFLDYFEYCPSNISNGNEAEDPW